MSIKIRNLAKVKKKKSDLDSLPLGSSERGTFIPLLLGTRRVPPVFAWAGNRKIRSKPAATGGKGGGGADPGTNTKAYRESGWHILALGPVSQLSRIYENGELLYKPSPPLTPQNAPSGSVIFPYVKSSSPSPPTPPLYSITQAYFPSGYVWKGEYSNVAAYGIDDIVYYNSELYQRKVVSYFDDGLFVDVSVGIKPGTVPQVWQPIYISNGELIEKSTDEAVSSNKKLGMFRIYWGDSLEPGYSADPDPLLSDITKGIGIASHWPGICYVVWEDKDLGESPRWPSLEYEITAPLDKSPSPLSVTAEYNDGINPANALNHLLTAPYPYGCGIPSSYINTVSLTALGNLMEEENIAFNVLASEGESAKDQIQKILDDAGVFLSEYEDGLCIVPLRPSPAVTILTEDAVAAPEAELEYDCSNAQPNRIVFMYSSKDKGYADADIPFDNDSSISISNNTKATTVDIPCVTNHSSAVAVANRRVQEYLTDIVTFKIVALRDARALRPGQTISIEELGVLRIDSILIPPNDGKVSIDAFIDYYGTDPEDYLPPAPSSDQTLLDPSEDIALACYELPEDIASGNPITILRVRSNEQIIGSFIYGSVDGETYSELEQQDGILTAGGFLDSEFSSYSKTIIEEGPIITALNDDILDIATNLTGNEHGWRTGQQLCFINDEVFFLREVESLGGDSYRLKGLIRARYGTLEATHPAGSKVFITKKDLISSITHNIIQPNTALYVRSQPYTYDKILALEDTTPITRTITGLSYRPLPPDNFFGNGDNTFTPGGYVTFSWTYRVKKGYGAAAGEFLAGDPINDPPALEGYFEIVLTDGRTLNIIDGSTSVLYTNAQMLEDFGGEPDSIEATLTHVLGGYRSETRTVSILRDTTQSTVDTTPPLPSPITWSTVPTATNSTTITMQASSASDTSGIQYYFECLDGPGHNSGWQSSRTYVDAVVPGMKYQYRVRARDMSPLYNLGDWSDTKTVYTDPSSGVWRGDWSSSTSYVLNDLVKYGRSTYICILANTNKTPSSETSYWSIFAQGGVDGTSFEWEGTWSSASIYYDLNDLVEYHGSSYVCVSAHTSNASRPPTNASFWNKMSGGMSFLGEWNNSTAFKINDVVAYNGSAYICIQDNTNQLPTNTSYWTLFAQKGDSGADAQLTSYNLSHPVLSGYSPSISAGTVTWGTFSVYYGGHVYNFNSGSSSNTYHIIDFNTASYSSNNGLITANDRTTANIGGKRLLLGAKESDTKFHIVNSFALIFAAVLQAGEIITDSAQIKSLTVDSLQLKDACVTRSAFAEIDFNKYINSDGATTEVLGFTGIVGVKLNTSKDSSSASGAVDFSGCLSFYNDRPDYKVGIAIMPKRFLSPNIVTYNNRQYFCIKSHTSTSSNNPEAGAANSIYWCYFKDGSDAPAWASGQSYSCGTGSNLLDTPLRGGIGEDNYGLFPFKAIDESPSNTENSYYAATASYMNIAANGTEATSTDYEVATAGFSSVASAIYYKK